MLIFYFIINYNTFYSQSKTTLSNTVKAVLPTEYTIAVNLSLVVFRFSTTNVTKLHNSNTVLTSKNVFFNGKECSNLTL